MTDLAWREDRANQTKNSLPSREATLASIIDAAPVGYIVIDRELTILGCDGRGIVNLALTSDTGVGRRLNYILRERPRITSAVRRAFFGVNLDETATINGCTFAFRCVPAAHDARPDTVTIVVTEISEHTGANAGILESHLSDVLDTISDGVLMIDAQGSIIDANKPSAYIFGYPTDEILGQRILGLIPDLLLEGTIGPARREMAGRRKDGSAFSINLLLGVSNRGGNTVYTATIGDLSTHKVAEYALKESEERYALAASGSNDGLWEWNLENGTVHFSARWRQLLGLEDENINYSPEEWLGRIHPDDVVAFCECFDAHLEGASLQFDHEYRMRHADGEFRWVRTRGVAARRENGEPYRLAGSQSDITDRKLAEERLTHGAMHDALTGLPNRALVLDRTSQALARLERNGEHNFAFAILDLDRFMVVNDSLGHAAGDELLVLLARRLEPEMAAGYTLARLGGDEFAILLEDYESFDEVTAFVKHLQEVIARPFDMDGEEIVLSGSFGVAVGAAGYKRAEEMLRDADVAMYRAKKEGLSGFETFDETRHRRPVDQLQIETGLRRALEKGEILVYYQPIVDLSRGVITGFEALARMRHPSRGIVPPSEFIGIAEETGLIIPLGEQVLEMACATAARWQRRFGMENRLSMSVNLSARHISEDNIVELLADVLARTKLPPSNLKVEITETLIMTNPELAEQALARIKELGVTLSLDDFGTGYSSLSYLRRFPIDTLKMDRSFVSRIDTDTQDLELVRMIILLAHTLGMEVTGEGIETESQLKLLRDLNCEFGQGYLFSKPLPEDAAAELLANPPVWR